MLYITATLNLAATLLTVKMKSVASRTRGISDGGNSEKIEGGNVTGPHNLF